MLFGEIHTSEVNMWQTTVVVVFSIIQFIFAHANPKNLRTVVKEGKLLNQYAMLATHDSATGELNEERDHILARWSNTQNVGIVDQLNCGARIFDYRPFLSDEGTLFAHHGPVVIYKEMEVTLRELLHWGKSNPSELIIFQISHCVEQRVHNNYYAESCHDAAISLLEQYKIPVITNTDCSVLNTMTMESALSKGNVLAMFGCSFGYWDPSLTCSDKEYICYDSWPQNTSTVPWNNLVSSVTKWASFVPVNDGILWGFGVNWQSSAESDIFGTLHNSSLVLDEERSNLNAWTANAITDGKLQYLNIVSVDNVCHDGPDIFRALQKYNSLH